MHSRRTLALALLLILTGIGTGAAAGCSDVVEIGRLQSTLSASPAELSMGDGYASLEPPLGRISFAIPQSGVQITGFDGRFLFVRDDWFGDSLTIVDVADPSAPVARRTFGPVDAGDAAALFGTLPYATRTTLPIALDSFVLLTDDNDNVAASGTGRVHAFALGSGPDFARVVDVSAVLVEMSDGGKRRVAPRSRGRRGRRRLP